MLEANDRTVVERLSASKRIASTDEPVPTALGLLVIGKDPRAFLPGAYVQFLRVDGNDLGDGVVDERVIDGAVSDVVRRLDCRCSDTTAALMPLAQEARKPMFALKPADGAIGGHAKAVQDCHRDFRALAREVARRCGIALP